jgi:hypothetical protein
MLGRPWASGLQLRAARAIARAVGVVLLPPDESASHSCPLVELIVQRALHRRQSMVEREEALDLIARGQCGDHPGDVGLEVVEVPLARCCLANRNELALYHLGELADRELVGRLLHSFSVGHRREPSRESE